MEPDVLEPIHPVGLLPVSRLRPAILACLLLAAGGTAPLQAQEHGSSPLNPVVLDALERALQSSNPELAVRRAAVRAAETGISAVGWAPPVTLAAEVEELRNATELGGAEFRVVLEREFLTGGRRSAARDLAGTDVQLAQAALYAADRRVLARSSVAILQIVEGTSTARRLAEEDSLLQSAESSVRARWSVGEARYVDVLRLRTERLRVQTDRAAAVTQANLGRATLSGLLGPQDRGRILALVDSLTLEDPSLLLAAELPPAPDPESLLSASAAVRLADATAEEVRAGRALLLAEQQPRITGGIGAQRLGQEPGGSSFGPALGLSISLPFTASRGNQAARVAADQRVEAVEAARSATFATVRAELAAAYERYEAARTRLGLFEEALLEGAREERESALAAYRNGDLALIELIDFERALSRAEIERLRAHVEAAAALVDLLYTPHEVREGLALDTGSELERLR